MYQWIEYESDNESDNESTSELEEEENQIIEEIIVLIREEKIEGIKNILMTQLDNFSYEQVNKLLKVLCVNFQENEHGIIALFFKETGKYFAHLESLPKFTHVLYNEYGLTETFKILLSHIPSNLIYTGFDNTVYHEIVNKGDYEILRLITDKNLLKYKNQDRSTILHHIILKKDSPLDIIKYLINLQPNIYYNHHGSYICNAVTVNRLDIVLLLISYGYNDFWYKGIEIASRLGLENMLTFLIKYQENNQKVSYTNKKEIIYGPTIDEIFNKSVGIAIKNNHQNIANIIIEIKPLIVQHEKNYFAFIGAFESRLKDKNDNINIVKYLIDKKYNIHGKNRYNETILMLAARYGLPNITKYLLYLGCDINATRDVGYEKTKIKTVFDSVLDGTTYYQKDEEINFYKLNENRIRTIHILIEHNIKLPSNSAKDICNNEGIENYEQYVEEALKTRAKLITQCLNFIRRNRNLFPRKKVEYLLPKDIRKELWLD